MLKNQKGFTLMELMMVIVIIGVLAAIGVPAYTGYVNKARDAACLANRRSLMTANGLLFAETEAYATALADLDEYVDTAGLVCKQGGTYTFNADGTISCDKHASMP